jgi:molybdate transport system regulatory protein
MIEVEAHIVIKRNGDAFLCPQKVKLLIEVHKQGSLSAAAKAIGISYQHAWNLVAELNRAGAEPLWPSSVADRTGAVQCLRLMANDC